MKLLRLEKWFELLLNEIWKQKEKYIIFKLILYTWLLIYWYLKEIVVDGKVWKMWTYESKENEKCRVKNFSMITRRCLWLIEIKNIMFYLFTVFRCTHTVPVFCTVSDEISVHTWISALEWGECAGDIRAVLLLPLDCG